MLFISLFLTYEFSEVKTVSFALLAGIVSAIFDEIHQLFIPGRSGQILDVFIDTIGIAIGSCLLMMIYKTIQKIFAMRKDGVLE